MKGGIASLREGTLEAYRFDGGSGWGAPLALATPDATEVWVPSVALDEGERGGWAVWVEVRGSRRFLVARRYLSGSGWAPQATVLNEENTYPVQGLVVGDGRGGAVVVWSEAATPASPRAIMSRRYVAE